MSSFEQYFLSILHGNDAGKFKKLHSLYEPVLVRCLNVTFPEIQKTKVIKAVDAAFKYFEQNSNCNNITDSSRFEVLLTGILFSDNIKKIYGHLVDGQAKSRTRKLMSELNEERTSFFNRYQELYTGAVTEKLKLLVPDSEEAKTIAFGAFEETLFTVERFEKESFFEIMEASANILAKEKGYGRQPNSEQKKSKIKSAADKKSQSPYSDPCAPQLTDVITPKILRRRKRLKNRHQQQSPGNKNKVSNQCRIDKSVRRSVAEITHKSKSIRPRIPMQRVPK